MEGFEHMEDKIISVTYRMVSPTHKLVHGQVEVYRRGDIIEIINNRPGGERESITIPEDAYAAMMGGEAIRNLTEEREVDTLDND